MRPMRYYAVFADGRVIAVVLGHKEARRLSPHRAYKSFMTRLRAEEFAAWWNYRSVSTMGRTS